MTFVLEAQNVSI